MEPSSKCIDTLLYIISYIKMFTFCGNPMFKIWCEHCQDFPD